MRAKAVAALLAAAALGVGACGDDEGDSAGAGLEPAIPVTTSTPEPETVTATTAKPAAKAKGKTRSGISTDLASKPDIPKPSGKAPTKLVSKDIVVGKGRGAKAGDKLVMQYVGVLHENGEQFDASWDSGQPFPFTLGEGGVIPGWDEGMVGMKAGGRRMLTIPPDLAYGEAGQGASIPPNSTLVFVVDLVELTPA